MIRASSVVLFVVLVCQACSSSTCSSEERTNAELEHDLARLSAALGLPLPPETKVLWVQHEEGMDDMTRAKLVMSTGAFAEIVPKLPIKIDDLVVGSSELGPDYKGWDPDSISGMRSGEAQLEGGRALHFGYAERDGTVVLFVVNFGT